MDQYQFDITLRPYGNDGGTVEIDSSSLYGCWEHKDGTEGGGLWFQRELINGRLDKKGPLELIDYDGAFSLPLPVIKSMRDHGIIIDEDY